MKAIRTYDRLSLGESISVGGQVDVDDVTKGVGGELSDSKLALLGLWVVVEPLVRLSESSVNIRTDLG